MECWNLVWDYFPFTKLTGKWISPVPTLSRELIWLSRELIRFKFRFRGQHLVPGTYLYERSSEVAVQGSLQCHEDVRTTVWEPKVTSVTVWFSFSSTEVGTGAHRRPSGKTDRRGAGRRRPEGTYWKVCLTRQEGLYWDWVSCRPPFSFDLEYVSHNRNSEKKGGERESDYL